MRRLIQWFLLVSFFAVQGVAALVFEQQEIRETVEAGAKKASTVFKFKNSGTATVIIHSVEPGCGCTTAELSQEVYAPGEVGEIKVVFNFEGRVGRQDRIIKITTDDETNKLILLTFRVDITEPLKCSTHLLLWRLGETVADKEVTIIPTRPRKIKSVTAQPDAPGAADVSVRVEPTGTEGNFHLVIRPASSAKAINVPIACGATFTDGTTQTFTVFALVR